MKKTLLTFLFLEWITFSYAQRAPVTPNASTGARNVLSFFYQLRKNNQILLGQNLGHGTGISLGYVNYVEGLNSKIGKYIGFVGGDYGLDPNHDVQVSNQILIEHSRKGGIVTVSWHFDNPWTGGDSWDTNNQENLLDLINQSQCNSPCKKWNAQKIQIANALRPLRDSNVPVLWRPLHEMNGDWFWWGQKTWSGHENGYIELWRDLFNFLSRDQKLNNLIWVFSAANTWDRLLKSYFPGSDVVDIIGIDIYGDEAQSYFSQRDYSDLQSLGDFPMGLTEFGPNLKSANGNYDYRRLLTSLDKNWPQFCFSYSWSNWNEGSREVKVAYVSNVNILETFTRADVITLDEIVLNNNPPAAVPSPLPINRPALKPTKRPVNQPVTSVTVKTANPKATDAARQVLQFLSKLSKDNKILLGQDLGHGSNIVPGYDKYVTKLFDQTKKWLGFIGGDYGLDVNHNPTNSNRIFIDHFKKGGIVTISWTMDNPWTGGDAWDTNQKENLWELIDYGNCNYACENWNGQKEAVAAALRPLSDSGVPVLWRPLHEMNGYWFWWCQKTWPGHEQAFIAVWKDMFDFLTSSKGLNNLLWVYSAASSWDPFLKNYYPGPEYVDVVGIDVYSDDAKSYFTERDYRDLKSLGKHPMGLTEFGPTRESAQGKFDYRRLINSMNKNWPDFCFSYSWHNWFEDGKEVKMSYSTNQGVKNVFSRSQVITLDEIDLTSKLLQPPSRKPTSLNLPTKRPNGAEEFRIKNRWAELYLTLVDLSNGGSMRLMPLDTTLTSQRWTIETANDSAFPNHRRLKCKWGNALYLNAVADENNADVVGWSLNEAWWSMRWSVNVVEKDIFRMVNMWGNRCLTIKQDPESQNEWIYLEVYDCNSDWWSQQWILERVR